MSIRATKNMWVTRCEHIGALVGGFLSLLFGWIPKLCNWVKRTGPVLILVPILATSVYYFIGEMREISSRRLPADIKTIKSIFNGEDDECRKRVLTEKIEYLTKLNRSITNQDLTDLKASCKAEIEVNKQKELLKELKQ